MSESNSNFSSETIYLANNTIQATLRELLVSSQTAISLFMNGLKKLISTINYQLDHNSYIFLNSLSLYVCKIFFLRSSSGNSEFHCHNDKIFSFIFKCLLSRKSYLTLFCCSQLNNKRFRLKR